MTHQSKIPASFVEADLHNPLNLNMSMVIKESEPTQSQIQIIQQDQLSKLQQTFTPDSPTQKSVFRFQEYLLDSEDAL